MIRKPTKEKTEAFAMEQAAFHFPYHGTPVSCERFGSGHINRTFIVTTDTGDRYILQCLSSVAFHDIPGLMDNIIRVTQHIAAKTPGEDSTLHFLPADNRLYYYLDESGAYWRSYRYVDAICIQLPETPDDFYQSAVAFGTFQNQLSDFPAETLTETIPNFHNTPDRYRKFWKAIADNLSGRAGNVQPEIDFYLSREEAGGSLQRMRDQGILPLRVTHNDTKLNNVLLDEKTRKAVCVIDLDTVMPGLSAFDFGDSIRFGASTAAEDEQDLEKVSMDLELFRTYAEGFIAACPGLTPEERAALPIGAKIMTLECGMRFLTDYLDGDHYFKTAYPEHNLVRARTQMKLVADMEEKWSEMERIVAAL
ncbi:MAG: aminoglycoside phosphotransferase family protein [Oscillospiraceae bacterium]|nr:aminoglycoside phosphotransferase family protein [Oscillospiraceae bacterium]